MAAAAAALSPSYKRHRFPAEIISHCVWLYFCLPLSYCQGLRQDSVQATG